MIVLTSPLRVGVVGLGIRGFWVSHLARECSDMELVALADMSPQMRAIAADKFPAARLYDSGEAMAAADDLAAVLVTTGDRFHAGNALEALSNGKHVLIEKPMAQSFADLTAIARGAREHGAVVGAFLELRQAPLWRHVKQSLDGGEIGEVLAAQVIDHVGRDKSQFFARSRTRTRDTVVSLVLQKGVHTLDLLNWFMGAAPTRVSAIGKLLFFGGDKPADKHCRDCEIKDTCPHAASATGGLPTLGIEFEHGEDYCVFAQACDVEDASFVNIQYASGRLATYSEIHFAPYYGVHFTLYGTKAQLDVEANHDTGQAFVQITERYSRNQHLRRPTRDTGHGNADGDLLSDFATSVREGKEPVSGLRAGFESAAIAIAARQSTDSAAFVNLPLLDEV